MGSVLSSVFRTIAPGLAEQVKYISGLEDNVKALEDAILMLEARSADVLAEIGIQERRGLLPLHEVRLWLSDVEAIEPQVCLLLDASAFELRRLSMYGYCSNNFCLTYPYAKEVWEKLKKVERLLSNRRADGIVARRGLPPNMEERPTQDTVGLKRILKATWKRLMQDEVGILGLYGMGGIGKTTLLEQINNRFLENRDEFDIVISVSVSQDLQIGRIQKEIGRRLGLCLSDGEWEHKTCTEKAYDINKVLTQKRFVMLLDDIWRKVELKEIGIPLPSPKNRSKVVFTTRSKMVCGRMGADVDMELQCLNPWYAWELFQKKVGANTLASDPEIIKLARIVCGKCKGLPLALKVIGETMACKTTIHEWKDAISVLISNAAEYPEVEEEILKILKFSYNDLKDERVKKCFQYCALFPGYIEKEKLVDCWIYEGIINGGGDKEKAMNHGYGIIGILVSACLLIRATGEHVIMHQVVRQMALWIGSNFEEGKENFFVKTGAGLHQMPEFENGNAVRWLSLGNSQIQSISFIPDCPNLTTLFLQKNKLVNISGECFLSLPKLVVLDLSGNLYLKELPEEVSQLEALRYLSLAGTALNSLPMGLRELIQLRHLDLDQMSQLESISVISSLLNLETLKVFFSASLSLELVQDISKLLNLKLLTVTIKEFSVLERLLSIPRLASCIQGIYLKYIGAEKVSLATTKASLRRLMLVGGSVSDLMADMRYGCSSPSSVCFQYLDTVNLTLVTGIQDLTCFLFAPSLTSLLLGFLRNLREIISKEKVSGLMNARSSIKPFQKLRMLTLYSPTATDKYLLGTFGLTTFNDCLHKKVSKAEKASIKQREL